MLSRPTVAVVALLLLLTGCGGTADARSSASSSPSQSASKTPDAPSSSVSETASASASPTPAMPDSACLLSVAEVSTALEGTWQILSDSAESCTYASSRGAAFGIQDVKEPEPELGLAAARAGCPAPKPVPGSEAFVCRDEEGVVGSIIVAGRLYVVVIPVDPPVEESAPAQERALITVLGQIERG